MILFQAHTTIPCPNLPFHWDSLPNHPYPPEMIKNHHKLMQQRPQQHFWFRRHALSGTNSYSSRHGAHELDTWLHSRGERSAPTNSAQLVSEKTISLRYIISTKLIGYVITRNSQTSCFGGGCFRRCARDIIAQVQQKVYIF